MQKTLRNGLVAGALAVAVFAVGGASPASASAIITSHNGTVGSTPIGSGAVDVDLICSFDGFAEDCDKTFNEIATHEIVWGGTRGSIDETVLNETGITWTDYHISLSGDFLFFLEDWTSGLPPGTTIQGGIGFSDIWLLFGGGGFATGQKFAFEFSFFSPSEAAPVTISQTPTIPEPGSLAIFGLGLLGLGLARRRGKTA